MPRQAELTPIDVVVGVVTDEHDRILIQQRSDGPFAGLWELPGGKTEPGESRLAALRRELHEELGILVGHARPLINITHRYPDRVVVLNTFCVVDYQGRARGAEGQPVQWVARHQLFDQPMLPADHPLTMAINLPDRYLVTTDPGPELSARREAALLDELESCVANGARLVWLRCPSLSDHDYERLARGARSVCGKTAARLMLHGGVERARLARRIDGVGLHVSAQALTGLRDRPLARGQWLAVSARTADELEQATAVGADFAVLSCADLAAERSRLAQLIESASLPVYAMGGVGPRDIAGLRDVGSQGIAATRVF